MQSPQLKNRKNLPVYLFKKLDHYIAVSTATGDFYDLSQETYIALRKWNEKLLTLNTPLTVERAIKLAKVSNIPKEIIKLFSLSKKSTFTKDNKKVTTCITDITLNLTSQCNLRCVYCWNDQGKYSNTHFQKLPYTMSIDNTKNVEMPIEIAYKSVDMLIKLCGTKKNLVIDFYGGEPLINLKTLMSTVDYCRKNESVWKANFHFLLATNGTLLTPSLAKELIDKGVQIALSIDGPKQIHDNNRPFMNGKGSFDKIISNLKNMPKKTLKRIVGRTTVTPFYLNMVELYKTLKKLGFERIELFESEDACHKINPHRESIFFHTDQQYKILYKEYERLALTYINEVTKGLLDYKKTFFNRFFKLMQRLYYNNEVTGGCPAAKGQLAISTDGNIYPCTAFLGIEKFKFGNVKEGLDVIRYNNFIENINRQFDYCKDCTLFSLCRSTGSCLNMNYYFNSDPALPYQRNCTFFREKIELALASLAILSEKIPQRLEELFGFDPAGKRGNELY